MDIATLRKETKGIDNVIHFNNAGASLIPTPVYEATIAYLERELNFGGSETAAKYHTELEEIYGAIAQFINAKPEEIACTENATAAWGMAFYSIAFKKGDTILTSRVEYASNYISYLHIKKRFDVEIKLVPSDELGQVSVNALEKAIDEKVKLISITHIPTNGGLVNPAEAIGKIAKKYGILYLLDTCQSVGQYPVDVAKIGCDFLTATGRKYLRAPRGTGFLYVRKEILPTIEPVMLDLHAAEWTEADRYVIKNNARRFENWETNMANKIGLKTAVQYATNIGIEKIWARIQNLADTLRIKLAEIPRILIQDMGKVKCGIVTFSVDGKDLKEVKQKLYERSINVSISLARSTLLDMQFRDIDALIRASLHYYNTEEEIEIFCKELREIIT